MGAARETPGDAGSVETASRVFDALQDLPLTAHTLAFAGLVAGFLLWGFGRRLTRVGVGGLGLVAGGVCGFFVPAALGIDTAFGVSSSHVGAIAGGVVGLALAIVLLRLVVAVAAVVVFLGAGAVIAGAVAQFVAEGEKDVPPLETAQMLLSGPATAENEDSPEPDDAPPGASSEEEGWAEEEAEGEGEGAGSGETGHRVRRFLRAGWREVAGWWDRQPGVSQTWVAIGALGGSAVGLLLGVVAPRRAARVVTSLIGAALWLGSAVWLLAASGLMAPELAPLASPPAWIVAWAVTAAGGVLVQRGLDRGEREGSV